MASYLQMLTKFPEIAKITIFLVLCIPSLLFPCSDIEKKLGPKYLSLTFCRWNLNSLTAHDSIKISILQAYVTQYNYDIICLKETFLNTSTDSSDTSISIDGYNLKRSDHPRDLKRGGVCNYYKEHIPLIKQDDICTLDHCLVTEICSQNKKCFLTSIYYSPNQNHEEFENFCINFDLLLSKTNWIYEEIPICSIITGDFNACGSNWWENITSSVGEELDSLTSLAGYSQVIDKPTHIVNDVLSCNDLIFCKNTKVISKHRVDVSIFEKCLHNIIFGKIDIHIPLSPAYVHKVWDYSKTSAENIKKAIFSFNWNKAFENLLIDAKVELLNETSINIFRNYIPNKKN